MHITSGTKPPGVFARYGVPLSLASGSRRSRPEDPHLMLRFLVVAFLRTLRNQP